MPLPRSPLAPEAQPELPPIAGVKLTGAACGIRYSGRKDLMVMELAEGTSVAGVFTRSSTRAAPVLWCQEHIGSGNARAIVVNAGNANAFTGAAGMNATKATAEAAASVLGCKAEEVLISSTGVIGELLPHEKITNALPDVFAQCKEDGWADAADAIRTTDTFAKMATRTVKIGQGEITINGIAKGSGMIAPNMATMLGYIVTDAVIAPDLLQQLLGECNQKSFNAITVDSDTSTNDCVLLAATNANTACPELRERHVEEVQLFEQALLEVMIELAQLIVRDGEGASKFITVHVGGAKNHDVAHTIGLAIANSPLVKTAIAGEDPNWGRIVMAVGKSGANIPQEAISIAIGDTFIARDGVVVPGYDETPVAAYMKGQEIDITVEVGKGSGHARIWTCDLTHGYIDINADYRS